MIYLVGFYQIRPEDLHHYEAIGYDNFKIVERNTPTPALLRRVHAYASRRYDGNLFDLVLPFNYSTERLNQQTAKPTGLAGKLNILSRWRTLKYFFKPRQVNLLKFKKVSELSKSMGLMHLREEDAKSPLYLDNRKLDGFLGRFLKKSCIDMDCEKCRYCHNVAKKAVYIDPEYKRVVMEQYNDLFKNLHEGGFWEPYYKTVFRKLRKFSRKSSPNS